MSNITDFLPNAAYKHIDGKLMSAVNYIDFEEKNASSGDTVDALKIPKGAIVVDSGFVVHETEDTVTIAVGDQDSATKYLAAQTLTDIKADSDAVEGAAITNDTTTQYKKFYPSDNTLRLTIGGAAATSARITAFAVYFMIPKSANA
jgi:hypothetical protein